MSTLLLLRQPCRCSMASSSAFPTYIRQFSSSPAVLGRVKKPASKAAQAALAHKKALKRRRTRSIYDSERMELLSAIHVLRAVEVSSPNSLYELTVKTAMPRGSALPKGRVNLPKEPKAKTSDRILVFAEGQIAEEAKKAGAEFVGGTELVEDLLSGHHKATLILCTPALIKSITPRLGRVLGPRGLMPSERRGTVTDDIATYIRRLQGTNEWKADKTGTIRSPVAKMNYSVDDVIKNVRYFLQVIKKATGNQRTADGKRPKEDTKPVNAITKVILSSRQGPGIQLSDF